MALLTIHQRKSGSHKVIPKNRVKPLLHFLLVSPVLLPSASGAPPPHFDNLFEFSVFTTMENGEGDGADISGASSGGGFSD